MKLRGSKFVSYFLPQIEDQEAQKETKMPLLGRFLIFLSYSSLQAPPKLTKK